MFPNLPVRSAIRGGTLYGEDLHQHLCSLYNAEGRILQEEELSDDEVWAMMRLALLDFQTRCWISPVLVSKLQPVNWMRKNSPDDRRFLIWLVHTGGQHQGKKGKSVRGTQHWSTLIMDRALKNVYFLNTWSGLKMKTVRAIAIKQTRPWCDHMRIDLNEYSWIEPAYTEQTNEWMCGVACAEMVRTFFREYDHDDPDEPIDWAESYAYKERDPKRNRCNLAISLWVRWIRMELGNYNATPLREPEEPTINQANARSDLNWVSNGDTYQNVMDGLVAESEQVQRGIFESTREANGIVDSDQAIRRTLKLPTTQAGTIVLEELRDGTVEGSEGSDNGALITTEPVKPAEVEAQIAEWVDQLDEVANSKDALAASQEVPVGALFKTPTPAPEAIPEQIGDVDIPEDPNFIAPEVPYPSTSDQTLALVDISGGLSEVVPEIARIVSDLTAENAIPAVTSSPRSTANALITVPAAPVPQLIVTKPPVEKPPVVKIILRKQAPPAVTTGNTLKRAADDATPLSKPPAKKVRNTLKVSPTSKKLTREAATPAKYPKKKLQRVTRRSKLQLRAPLRPGNLPETPDRPVFDHERSPDWHEPPSYNPEVFRGWEQHRVEIRQAAENAPGAQKTARDERAARRAAQKADLEEEESRAHRRSKRKATSSKAQAKKKRGRYA